MPYEISFEKIEYKCGVEGCGFSVEVKNPNDLTEADAELLNLLLDPNFVFNAQQLSRLNELLGDKLECPDHGRQNVGFVVTEKHTCSAEYVLDMGPNENGDEVIILTPEPVVPDDDTLDHQ